MIILISGKMGSGKTTLTKTIVNHYEGSQYIKFADPLYECHEAVWNILEKYGIPREKKSRDFLQWLGTEFRRKRDNDMWINIAVRRMQTMASPDLIFVVDDARYENEFDAFPDALTIRLECDKDLRRIRAESWSDAPHDSEFGLDRYARLGKFDLYFDTRIRSPEDILDVIAMALRSSNPKAFCDHFPDDFESIYGQEQKNENHE